MLNKIKLRHLVFLKIGLALFIEAILFIVFYWYLNIDNLDLNESQFLFENWNNKPIADIKLSSNSVCPKEYELIKIGKFEKMDSGCFCSNRGFFYFGKDTSKCLKKNPMCQAITSKNEKPLYKWREMYLCAKFLDINYFNLTYVSLDDSCPDGYKRCGIIDSLTNVLCIENFKNCPINFLKIIDKNSGFNQSKVNDSTLLFQDFANSTFSLVSSNNYYNGKVVINLHSNYGGKCLIPHEVAYEEAFSYELINTPSFFNKCNGLLSQFKYHPYFFILDKVNKKQIFIENNIYDEYINLPFYPLSSFEASEYHLYHTIYHGFNKDCSNNISLQDYQKYHGKINDTFFKSEVYTFIALQICSIYVFLMFSEHILSILTDEASLSELITYFLWWIIFFSITLFLCFETIKIKEALVFPLKIFKDSISSMDCLDKVSSVLINYYYERLTKTSYLVAVVLSSVLIIVESVLLILMIKKFKY